MKIYQIVVSIVAVLLFATSSNSTLTNIGTAQYGGSLVNLIWDDPGTPGPSNIWLDVSNGPNTWGNQMTWASGLSLSLSNFDTPGYNLSWVDGSNWRLPEMYDSSLSPIVTGIIYGNFSEMGKIQEVDNASGSSSPFTELENTAVYWLGTSIGGNPGSNGAWDYKFQAFDNNGSLLGTSEHFGALKNNTYYAMALRGANVSIIDDGGNNDPPAPVPEPSTLILFGAGIAGIAGYRRRRKY